MSTTPISGDLRIALNRVQTLRTEIGQIVFPGTVCTLLDMNLMTIEVLTRLLEDAVFKFQVALTEHKKCQKE